MNLLNAASEKKKLLKVGKWNANRTNGISPKTPRLL